MILAPAAVLGTIVLSLAVLTGLGQHRRGGGTAVVVTAGAFFPVAWLVWYLVDERPYLRALQRSR